MSSYMFYDSMPTAQGIETVFVHSPSAVSNDFDLGIDHSWTTTTTTTPTTTTTTISAASSSSSSNEMLGNVATENRAPSNYRMKNTRMTDNIVPRTKDMQSKTGRSETSKHSQGINNRHSDTAPTKCVEHNGNKSSGLLGRLGMTSDVALAWMQMGQPPLDEVSTSIDKSSLSKSVEPENLVTAAALPRSMVSSFKKRTSTSSSSSRSAILHSGLDKKKQQHQQSKCHDRNEAKDPEVPKKSLRDQPVLLEHQHQRTRMTSSHSITARVPAECRSDTEFLPLVHFQQQQQQDPPTPAQLLVPSQSRTRSTPLVPPVALSVVKRDTGTSSRNQRVAPAAVVSAVVVKTQDQAPASCSNSAFSEANDAYTDDQQNVGVEVTDFLLVRQQSYKSSNNSRNQGIAKTHHEGVLVAPSFGRTAISKAGNDPPSSSKRGTGLNYPSILGALICSSHNFNDQEEQEWNLPQRRRRSPFYPITISSSHNKRDKMANKLENDCKWRTAVCPKSGKTYYYHSETRETQWRKPMELATPEERQAMEDKERQQREFFAAMEANIIKSISEGAYAPSGNQSVDEGHEIQVEPRIGTFSLRNRSSHSKKKGDNDNYARPSLIRTISSMEESVITDLVKRVPSHRNLFATRKSTEIALSPNDVSANLNGNSSHRLSRNEVALDKIDEGMLANKKDDITVCRDSGGKSKPEPQKELSMGTLIRGLPDEGTKRSRSFYNSTIMMGGSEYSLGLTSEESMALQELATISDAMSQVEELDDGEIDTNGGGIVKPQLGVLSEAVEEEDQSECSDGTNRALDRSYGTLEIPDMASIAEETVASFADETQDTASQATRRITVEGKTSKALLQKPPMSRRNTCGTLYVGSTLSAPDKDATIKCVCAVFRAHILQSESKEDFEDPPEYRMFNDLETQQKPVKSFRAPNLFVVRPPPPSLDEITTFFRDVFRRAQMESDCLIMSLIYVERLIKTTHGRLRPRTNNWRSILFSCLVLSSKVWDDLSMWNADFSQTCPAGVKFSLQRINEVEVAVLSALNYKVKVLASEYAKYYFLLRSMLIKSGLGGDDLRSMSPLDVEGAKRLQHVSTQYQNNAFGESGDGFGMLTQIATQRSKSVGALDRNALDSSSITDLRASRVGLEHVVHM